MKEASGDLWTFDAEFRCVTTNGVVTKYGLVMGAGVALQAKQRYPHLPEQLGRMVGEIGNFPFLFEQERIITIPTKWHWREKSSLNLIVCSIHKLVELVNDFEINSVVMTRPGCGNGQLSWEVVKAEIEKLLDDRFTVLTGE